MKRYAAAALILAGLLAGCSSGSGSSKGPTETVTLTAKDMAFGAKEIKIEKGKTYKLVLQNDDAVEHDFAIEKMPVKVGGSTHGDSHGSAALHVHAPAGKSESVEFTATESGSYQFVCTVAGHREAGMVGKLIVN